MVRNSWRLSKAEQVCRDFERLRARISGRPNLFNWLHQIKAPQVRFPDWQDSHDEAEIVEARE